MTKQEVSEQYNIPVEILQEYESWGLCDAVRDVMGAWRYDERDLERLSTIMSLHDIGFNIDEVKTYIRLLLQGESNEEKLLQMLNKKRSTALEEIHFKERQLERLDYLRYKMQKAKNKEN